MLPAQVSYWTLMENKRHNLVTEQLGYDTLAETQRHNVVGETEVGRHNVETEKLGWSTLGETSRHNVATENIGYGNLALGYANLNELTRHNVTTEGIQEIQAESSYRQSAAALKNAATNERQRQDAWRKFYYYEYPLKQKEVDIQQQRANTEQWYRAADVLRNSGFTIQNPSNYNGSYDSIYDADWHFVNPSTNVPGGWFNYTYPIINNPSVPLLPGG